MAFHAPQQFLTIHPVYKTSGSGNNGFFTFKRKNIHYRMVASDEMGWEHVSVSLSVKRCPDWEEMCMIKDLFWDKEDCVLQYHPPESEYVNYAPYVLHMWRPTDQNIPLPPSIVVGPKETQCNQHHQ